MTREERLEQQRVEILSRLVIAEHEVSVVDFEELKYMGRSISDIMDNQGWIGYLKRDDIASVDLRLIGAYPTVEMANKPDAEDIFRTFMGQNVVLVGPFVRQKFMLPLWRILHLICSYDIKPRVRTTECPIMRGELMLGVAKGCVVDLPPYIFLFLRSEAKTTSSAALSYNLLLTQFLYSVGYMDGPDMERKASICPICRTTLSRSEAQLRQQQQAPTPVQQQEVEKPPHRVYDQE
ncbi:hypothetical protein CJ030_MR1G003750 [Morella rubra]|uniref:Uncharacterized protein n=1 Tax=Morella rubra TaxID=262757 RepID=A0A6A1WNL5_9ROSI|nr:hypothetical protein CJ030_MR1G003750 [Morella rubra]